MRPVLDWPREAALPAPQTSAELVSPPSNLVLDLHGDPAVARLHVFSDGNHHMALADTVSAFTGAHEDVGDVFYATTPPRIIIDALGTGAIEIGNIRVTSKPHVFIGPGDILEKVRAAGHVADHRPFMQSQGTALLFTSLASAIWDGWIAHLPSQPRTAARLAWARNPSGSEKSPNGPSIGRSPWARAATTMRAIG